jgi:hypothetical protein
MNFSKFWRLVEKHNWLLTVVYRGFLEDCIKDSEVQLDGSIKIATSLVTIGGWFTFKRIEDGISYIAFRPMQSLDLESEPSEISVVRRPTDSLGTAEIEDVSYEVFGHLISKRDDTGEFPLCRYWKLEAKEGAPNLRNFLKSLIEAPPQTETLVIDVIVRVTMRGHERLINASITDKLIELPHPDENAFVYSYDIYRNPDGGKFSGIDIDQL